jgi:ubiquinone/menaquinone biosynthesis C-methylase UbiE
MDPEEYANLERVESKHWYYSGKREFVRRWINRVRPPRREDVLLDCGAGTGLFAKEMEAACRVLVLDDHEGALRILHTRFAPEQILSLAGDRVPLPDCSLDYVTALDVLEHVPDDAAVVRGFYRLLKPGGLAVVTVPASMQLWSDWDESLHHYRRYYRAELRALFPDSQWQVAHANYTNVLVYPVVWLVRKWRRLFPDNRDEKRAEDTIPSPLVNAVLQRVFVGMSMWRVPFPFGVSLLLVARRR